MQDVSCFGSKSLSLPDHTLEGARCTTHEFMAHAFAARSCCWQ